MAQDSVSAAAPASVAPAPRAAAGSRRLFVIGVVALVLAAAGVTYWAHSRRFEDTDDAQVDGNISNVSPRITGTVTGVFVSENQVVKAGDPLLEVDPTDLQIAVDQARAQVAQAQALLDAEDPSVPITQTSNTSAVSTARSDVAGAQSALAAAKSDVAQFTAQLAQAMAN
ncbi:MAG TPA: biotin/lipoyl-binding protein, partial [Polyangiaceae bacterium]